MQYLVIILVLGVNFWISWSNATQVGRYWSESKEIGGGFRKTVVCGYVMAIAGFTMVYCYLLLILAPFFFSLLDYSPRVINEVRSLGFDLMYVMVGAAVILSGFRLWAHSLKRAWEERSFAYMAEAVWNTFAQIHNVVNYARNAPSAAGRILGAIFGGKKKSKSDKDSGIIALLAIVIVVLALLGGYFTADAIMKRADAEYDGFAESYKAHEATA